MTELSGFERTDLEASGFAGWFPVSEVSADDANVPVAPGIYVVFSQRRGPGEFLSTNPAGWHKDQDPTVPSTLLEERWIDDAGVLFLGHTDNLSKRLTQLRRFSAGEPVGHYGGRLLWQVAFSGEFLVAWKETAADDLAEEKKDFVRSFKSTFGRQPFANIQRAKPRPEPR